MGSNHYRIGSVVGRGSFGVVYRAERVDNVGATPCALKVFAPRDTDIDLTKLRSAFITEAQTLKELSGKCFVSVIQVIQLDDELAIDMEYVDGVNGWALLKETGPFPVPVALTAIKKVASALAFEHERLALVHRDLKPGNLLFSIDGGIKIADLGSSSSEFEGRLRTRTGNATYTPGYAPPRDDNTKNQAYDVYALGAILYEFLRGENIWATNPSTFLDVYAGHLDRQLALVQAAPPVIDLMRQMLDMEPRNRPDLREVAHAAEEHAGLRAEGNFESFVRQGVANARQTRTETKDERFGRVYHCGRDDVYRPARSSGPVPRAGVLVRWAAIAGACTVPVLFWQAMSDRTDVPTSTTVPTPPTVPLPDVPPLTFPPVIAAPTPDDPPKAHQVRHPPPPRSPGPGFVELKWRARWGGGVDLVRGDRRTPLEVAKPVQLEAGTYEIQVYPTAVGGPPQPAGPLVVVENVTHHLECDAASSTCRETDRT